MTAAPVTLVIGASGGLGRAVVEETSMRGWPTIAASRSLDRARAAGEGATRASMIDHVAIDPTDAASVELGLDVVVERHGRVDHVMLMSGGSYSMLTSGDNQRLIDTTDEEWSLVLSVNLTSAFVVARAAGRRLQEFGGGSLLFVGSGAGHRPADRMAAYAAAKAGLVGLVRATAFELGPSRVRANLVIPGLTPHQNLQLGRPPEPYLRETMLGTLSTPDQFASFCAQLCTMPHLSGQVLNIDSRVLL